MNPESILVAKVAFWLSVGLVIYPYFLYPLVLFLIYSVTQAWRDLLFLGSPRNRRADTPSSSGMPGVSIIVPAYNEEKGLPAKIENLRDLDFASPNRCVLDPSALFVQILRICLGSSVAREWALPPLVRHGRIRVFYRDWIFLPPQRRSFLSQLYIFFPSR